jgi:hypothetical protein
VFAREKEEHERKRHKWMAIIIGIIMALSSAGFALNFATTETHSYKGLKFYQTEKGWQPKGISIFTSYLPQDVENITSSGTINYQNFNSKVYLIELPYMRSSALEFLQNVPVQNLQQACLPEYENEQFCSDLPTKSCEDADSQNVMLILDEANETSIEYSNYCLEIKGTSEELTKAADKALYQAYGII